MAKSKPKDGADDATDDAGEILAVPEAPEAPSEDEILGDLLASDEDQVTDEDAKASEASDDQDPLDDDPDLPEPLPEDEAADQVDVGPPPVTPSSTPEAAEDRIGFENAVRIGFENAVNEGAERFAVEAKAAYIDAKLKGQDIEILVSDPDS